MTSPGVGRPLSFHVGRIFVILSALTLVLSMIMIPAAFGEHNDNHNPPGQVNNPGQGQGNENPGQGNVGGGGQANMVWVCKKVNTPAGTVSHLIRVNESAAPDDFSDEHGSFVVGDVSLQDAQAACFGSGGPTPQVSVCAETNGTWAIIQVDQGTEGAYLDSSHVNCNPTTPTTVVVDDDPVDEEEEAEIQAPDEEDVLGEEEVLEDDEVLEEEEEVQQEEQTLTQLPRTGPESAPLFALIASLLMGAGGALLMLTSRRTSAIDLI
jgi:LPXTG-motif cell wall-anchored protein